MEPLFAKVRSVLHVSRDSAVNAQIPTSNPAWRACQWRSLVIFFSFPYSTASGWVAQRAKRIWISKLPSTMFEQVLLAAGPLGCVADALAATAMMSSDNVFFTPR